MFELTKEFRFDAAHTLQRRIDAEPSRRIHGHSYRAAVTIRGVADPVSGMVIDLGVFARLLEEVRDGLDHRFLDEVPDLTPATMETMSAWIWRRLAGQCPGLFKVVVYRDSGGEACAYYGPNAP